MKKFAFPVILTIALAVASMLVAQSKPAIGGYCPVAYKAMNKAMKGDPKFASTHDGQTFYLTNADAKKMYDANPAEYTPVYHSYCAAGVAKGMKIESDPTLFSVVDGKTYLFSSKEAKMMFDKEAKMMVAQADKNWPEVSKKPVSKMP
jgi:YHS domain-containing protein